MQKKKKKKKKKVEIERLKQLQKHTRETYMSLIAYFGEDINAPPGSDTFFAQIEKVN